MSAQTIKVMQRRIDSLEQTAAHLGNRLDHVVEALEIIEARVKLIPVPKPRGAPGRPRRPRAKASA